MDRLLLCELTANLLRTCRRHCRETVRGRTGVRDKSATCRQHVADPLRTSCGLVYVYVFLVTCTTTPTFAFKTQTAHLLHCYSMFASVLWFRLVVRSVTVFLYNNISLPDLNKSFGQCLYIVSIYTKPTRHKQIAAV